MQQEFRTAVRSATLLLALLGCPAASHAQVLPPVPHPRHNPTTPAKVKLGKVLFWDEQLSATRTVACATCHMPEAGTGDPRTASSVNPGRDGFFGTGDDVHGSPGVVANLADGTYVKREPFPMREQVTPRKAPPVLMAAYSRSQFWDGRAGDQYSDPVTGRVLIPFGGSLEAQSLAPPVSDLEMAHVGADWPDVARRMAAARPLALASDIPPGLAAWVGKRSYPDLFEEAFGTPRVSPVRFHMAIAAYERTLIPNQTPIDSFLAGNNNALTPQERRGFEVFTGAARCGLCHPAPLFLRHDFFNIGLRPVEEDPGRLAITNEPGDAGAFKIPTLRNVGLRAPFFHNGGKRTLEEVVDFYARGGDFKKNRSFLIRPFQLSTQDRDALLAFLRNALSDPRVERGEPPFDHPTLYTRSGRVPLAYGQGEAGTDGIFPRLLALEPPMVGNPSFTIGLDRGLGGAPAVLLLDPLAGNGQTLLGVRILVGGSRFLVLLDLRRLRGAGAGGGWASVSLPIPNEIELVGLPIHLQALVADRGAAQGLAATAGVRVTLFAPR